MVQESMAAGMGLVCFSGDKLLGGPQAGIIVGDAALVGRLRRHPLTRAVRPDKLTIAVLAATLDHYLREETLPSRLVAVRVESESALAGRLRRGEPPVVARLEADALLLDLRTVLP